MDVLWLCRCCKWSYWRRIASLRNERCRIAQRPWLSFASYRARPYWLASSIHRWCLSLTLLRFCRCSKCQMARKVISYSFILWSILMLVLVELLFNKMSLPTSSSKETTGYLFHKVFVNKVVWLPSDINNNSVETPTPEQWASSWSLQVTCSSIEIRTEK